MLYLFRRLSKAQPQTSGQYVGTVNRADLYIINLRLIPDVRELSNTG
jgi:hypothetical protein